MNTWLLLLNIIIQTSSGPVVYLDTVEINSRIECELMGEYMRGELLIHGQGMQASVSTTCILKSQRVM